MTEKIQDFSENKTSMIIVESIEVLLDQGFPQSFCGRRILVILLKSLMQPVITKMAVLCYIKFADYMFIYFQG